MSVLERNHHDLSADHVAYLSSRHGTVELDPIPSMDPADPYNWPSWKKNANLLLVALQGLTTVLNAAGIIPAIPLLLEDLHVSVHQITYLIGVQILFLGVAPLFWKPLANRYGRRPIWLVSSLGGAICNVGCVYSTTYGTLIATRILVAIFLSPALGLGGAVVTEMFFAHQRGRKLGIWTLAFTIGPSLGPLLGGFIVYHSKTWQWVFWFFSILSFATFILCIFFTPETLYPRKSTESVAAGQSSNSTFKRQYISLRRINPAPFTLAEIYEPYTMLVSPSVLIPACAYSMVFCLASPAVSIIIPSAYGEKFHLNAQQTGLQFIAVLIGAILGELIGGLVSDRFMNTKVNGVASRRSAEFRLWASYLGFAMVIAGILEWGITLQHAPVGPWTVVPDIGLGILSFGLQIVTTVLVTYAIDCYTSSAAAVGGAINQVRQVWSFIGPFWFVPMYESLGYAGAAGLMAGMVGIVNFPVVLVHVFGGKWRQNGDALKEGFEEGEKQVKGGAAGPSVSQSQKSEDVEQHREVFPGNEVGSAHVERL